MKRWLSKSCVALSLIWCAVLSVLWVRSFWVCDHFIFDRGPQREFWLRVDHGSLNLWKQRYIGAAGQTPKARFEHRTDHSRPDEPKPPVAMLNSTRFGFGAEEASPLKFEQEMRILRNLYLEQDNRSAELKEAQEVLDARIAYRDLRVQREYGMEFDLWLKSQNREIDQLRAMRDSREYLVRDFRVEAAAMESKRHVVWQAAAPMWALLLCVIWLPAIQFTKRRELRRRLRTGRCVACGYDLRATPDRCPECGIVPARR